MRKEYENISDEQLAQRAMRGDENAFEELMLRNESAVRRFVYMTGRRRDKVDDLAQETFLKAWNARKSYRGESKWKTWVLKIALNVCIDAGRKRESKLESLSDKLPDHLLASDPNKDGLISIDKACLIKIEELLDAMPEITRSIFYMRYIEEYTSAEIAEITGKPAGSIRRILLETRQSLKNSLDGKKNAPILVKKNEKELP